MLTSKPNPSVKTFRWVERAPDLPSFGPDHRSREAAIEWAKDWKRSSTVTPEHAEIFLIVIYNRIASISKPIITFGWL